MLRDAQTILSQMTGYQEMDRDIPSFGANNVIEQLGQAIIKERLRRKTQATYNKRRLSLRKIEEILSRETSCIDPVDVPLLMAVFYAEVGVEPPKRLVNAVAESQEALDCR